MGLELAEIYSDCFESKFELSRLGKTSSKKQSIDEIILLGEKCIYYYQKVLSYLQDEFNKLEEKSLEDLTTIVTIKLNIAKIYSKIPYTETKKRVNDLAASLKIYEETYNLITKSEFFKKNDLLKEQANICQEMISLLPVKINKINRCEEF